MGVSYKRLSGWEPTTEYVYDAAGLLVSSRPEVEWDETEVGWFRALQAWRDEDVCPSCGLPKAICQDPRLSIGGVKVPPPTRCHVTTALTAAQSAYEKTPGANPHGLLWGFEIKDPSAVDEDHHRG